MNSKDSNTDNDRLNKLLQSWRVADPLPPGFQDGVWRRIDRAQEAASPSAWETISGWVANALSKPALAASYVAVLLMLGMTVGWGHARQEGERVRAQLGEKYVQTLDPYLTSAHQSP